MKAQVSVEMLIIMGIGLTLISIYAIYGYSSVDSYRRGNDDFLVRDSLEKIAETSKFVSIQGPPAKQKINVCFPMSLQNCSVSASGIDCFLRDGQVISRDFETSLNGSMNISSGCWDINIKAEQSFVNLSI